MRKGITPVIAIILLLLLTVAAAGAAFLWISRVQDTIAEETQEGLNKDLKCLNSRIAIDNVVNLTADAGGAAANTLCVSIRNRGSQAFSSTDMQQMAFYVNGRVVDWDDSTTNTASLDTGDFRQICLCDGTDFGTSSTCAGTTEASYTYNSGWSAGESYETAEVTVEVSCGTGDSESYQANTS